MESECTVSARNFATQARVHIQGLRTPRFARVSAAGGGDRDPSGGRTSGGKDIENGEFCGACWSCGGPHRSDSCKVRWQQQLARAAFRLARLGETDKAILLAARQGLEQAGRRGKPGKAAVAVIKFNVDAEDGIPKPRDKKVEDKTKQEKKARSQEKKSRSQEAAAVEAEMQKKKERKAEKKHDKEEKRKAAAAKAKDKAAAQATAELKAAARDCEREEERNRNSKVREEREIDMRERMDEMEERVRDMQQNMREEREIETSEIEERVRDMHERLSKHDVKMRMKEDNMQCGMDQIGERVLQIERTIGGTEVSVITVISESRSIEIQQEEESRRAVEAAAALASARRPERRLAEDGSWYTLEEFRRFYGGLKYGMFWNQAHAAGARDG